MEGASVGPKERERRLAKQRVVDRQSQEEGRTTPTPSFSSVDDRRKGRARPELRLYLCGGSSRRRAVRPATMNPRYLKKAAPYLGAILLAAVVFTVVLSLL